MIEHKLIKKIIKGICKLFTKLNKIIAKNEKKIVLFSELGFRDNTKAVYDELIEKNYHHTYKIVCSLNDYKKYKEKMSGNVVWVGHFKGLFHYLTAKYVFYSFGIYPIKPSKKQIVVHLTHGSPFKADGNLIEAFKDVDYNFFTYVIATSETFKKIIQKTYSCNSDQFIIAGLPRNDVLFKANIALERSYQEYAKVIIWLPTFRQSEKLQMCDLKEINSGIPFFSTGQQLEELNQILKNYNIKLIVKLHPMQDTPDLFKEALAYEYIDLWTQKDLGARKLELNQLLKQADAMITDYSSAHLDFLLLDRPIAFTVNDMKNYNDARGFVFEDPLEFMPGFLIKNKSEFYRYLAMIKTEYDDYQEDRLRVNHLANQYKTGNYCQSIFDAIGLENEVE